MARPIRLESAAFMEVKTLCDHSGLTKRQVAEVLNLTIGGAVSKQLRKLSAVLERDKSPQKALADFERLICSHH